MHGYGELRGAILALVAAARRDIRLYAPRLNPHLFNTASVNDAFAAFAVQHARNRIRILIEDMTQVLRDNGRLLDRARRLGGSIELRELEESERGARDLYLLADRTAVLIQEAVEEIDGTVLTEKPRIGSLIQRFDNAWERAQPVGLRTLGL